jgi:hypothetical protein
MFIQADGFHKFNSIPVFILPQSENISGTNGSMVTPIWMSQRGKGLEKFKLMLTQPSLAGAWAELGNMLNISPVILVYYDRYISGLKCTKDNNTGCIKKLW